MSDYITKDGLCEFDFDYTAKERTNGNGVGDTWRELEIEISDFTVWQYDDEVNDWLEVVCEVEREQLIRKHHDELLDEVERLEQKKR